jgi:hypothetical protein
VLLSIGQLLVNQYAFDGDGLVRQALLPLSPRALVASRRGASLAFVALAGAPAFLLAALLTRASSAWLLLASALATAAAARVLVPVALGLSALLPKTVDPSRLGRASQPHQAAVLLWLPCVGLATGILWTLGALFAATYGAPAAAAFGALALAASELGARPIETVAAKLYDTRRETILLLATGR